MNKLETKALHWKVLLEHRTLLERRLGNYLIGSLGPLRLTINQDEVLKLWFSCFDYSEQVFTRAIKHFGTVALKGRLEQILSYVTKVLSGLDLESVLLFDLRNLLKSSQRKAIDTLQRFINFIEIFSLGEFTLEDQLQTYAGLYLLEFCNSLTSNLKYHLINLFNHYWGQELIARTPDIVGKPGHLWFGKTMRNFRKRLMFQASRNRCAPKVTRWEFVLYSFFQGLKKGLLPINDEEVLLAMVKHSKAMTNNPTHDVSDLEHQVRRTTNEFLDLTWKGRLLEYKTPSTTGFSKLWSPSRNACVEEGFAGAGFLGEFLRRRFGKQARADRMLEITLKHPELVGYENTSSGPIPIYTKFLFSEQLDIISQSLNTALEREMNSVLPVAQPATVLEPNKARIITKGEFDTYLPLKPFQKEMWSRLQSLEQFQLIGRPLDDMVLGLVGREYQEGDVFVSGDYASATDNFDKRLTSACVGCLLRRQPFELAQVFRRGIGVHTIDYAKWKKVQSDKIEKSEDSFYFLLGMLEKCPDSIEMLSAQLMGSPLSFIILCLVNFALTRYALEQIRGKVITMREAGILINGDDVLFCCPPDGVNVWKQIVTRGGLAPSVGKNYVSSEFVQLNSELYKVDYSTACGRSPSSYLIEGLGLPFIFNDERRVVSRFIKTPYLNFGLMLNRHKADSTKEEVEKIDFFSQYRDMVSFWDKHPERYVPVLERATQVFEEFHKDELFVFGSLERNQKLAFGGLGLRPWSLDSNLSWERSISEYTGVPLICQLLETDRIDPWTSYRTLFYSERVNIEVAVLSNTDDGADLGRKLFKQRVERDINSKTVDLKFLSYVGFSFLVNREEREKLDQWDSKYAFIELPGVSKQTFTRLTQYCSSVSKAMNEVKSDELLMDF
jgi:hypothetical protein